MTWALTPSRGTVPQFVKYIDAAKAEAWRALMRAYIAEDTRSWATAAGDEATQWRRVAEYFAALRGFALAIDLHPCELAWYGARRTQRDPGSNDIPGLYSDALIWQAPYRLATVDALNATSASYRAMVARARANELADLELTILLAVDLDASGAVVRRDGDLPAPPAGVARIGNGGGLVSTWATIQWGEGDGPAGRLEVIARGPLQWSYDLARAAMADCVAKPVLDSAARSCAWVAIRNAKLSQMFGGDGTPAEVVELARAWDIAAVTAPEPPTAWVAAMSGMGTITAALMATGVATPLAAVLAVAVGILFGIPLLLNRVFSLIFDIAVARGYDCWGRAQPFLARSDYTGDISVPRVPTHDVPEPPYTVVGSNPIGGGFAPDQPLIELQEIGQRQRRDGPSGSSGGGGGGGALLGAVALLWLLSRGRRA